VLGQARLDGLDAERGVAVGDMVRVVDVWIVVAPETANGGVHDRTAFPQRCNSDAGVWAFAFCIQHT